VDAHQFMELWTDSKRNWRDPHSSSWLALHVYVFVVVIVQCD